MKKNDVTINIFDGVTQIVPNAIKAVQNFYGDQFAEKILNKQEASEDHSPEVASPEPKNLALYISKDRIPGFLAQIRDCRNATELAKVVVSMLDQDSQLTEGTVVKEIFIQLLLPFATKLTTGKSINNLRARINDALIVRRKYHSNR